MSAISLAITEFDLSNVFISYVELISLVISFWFIVFDVISLVNDSSNVYVVCIVEFDSSNVVYLVVLVRLV